MHITLSIIERALTINPLADLIPQRRNRSWFADIPLKGTQLWTTDLKSVKDFAIIITSDDYKTSQENQPDYFDGCALLCIGEANLETANDTRDMLFFEEQIDPIKLSNRLQVIFSQFLEWQTILSDLSNTTKNLDYLLNTTAALMKMEMFIVDSEYNYIAYTEGFLAHNESWTGSGSKPPLDSVNSLLFDNSFAATFEKNDVFEYPSFIKDEIFLCYNIFYHGKYTARLLVQFSVPRPSQGDIAIVQQLGKAITDIYERYYNSLEDYSDHIQFRNILKKMISGSAPNPDGPKELLVYRNWKQTNTFQIVKFQLSLKKSTGISLEYFCSQIENAFSECCAVKLPEGVFCIRNISLGDSTPDFLRKLPYFLRENVCKAGISNEFSYFYDLYTFGREADKALVTGERTDSMLWYYHFRDYAYTYLKDQCAQEFPLDQVCHPAIEILKKYDERENAELYITLKTFFEEKYNGSHSADKLCIHRTTFFYRMKRIEALTGIDLDDFNERTYLMLSFSLMDS